MCLGFQQTLIFPAILACLVLGPLGPVGLPAPQNLYEAQAEVDALTAGFGRWADALESAVKPNSAWESPFGAPRPADLSDQEMKVVLSLRRLVLNESLDELSTLTDQVSRRQEPMPVQMRFWLAYAQNQLHSNQACLGNLKELLETEEGWNSLEIGQRAWVLTATADQLFLQDNRQLAASCYTRLEGSPVVQLNLWGQYQLAGLEFLARDFEQSARKYQRVCESSESGTWREHSCAMAAIAARLDKLGKGGRDHGAVASTNP